MSEFKSAVIAHRGASKKAPENTFSAFNQALASNSAWIEFDVTLASCGTPIIFHDEHLERTTDGAGLIHNQPYPELAKLDAGAWFAPQFAGEKIPTLAAMVDWLLTNTVYVNIELKPRAGDEATLVTTVLTTMKPLLESGRLLFSSFSLEALRALRRQDPACRIGLLLHEWRPDWEIMVDELACTSVHLNYELITPDKINAIKARGLSLLTYTVNDPETAKALLTQGVDAVFSDYPDLLNSIS